MKGDTSVKIRQADYDRLNNLRGPFTIVQVIGAAIQIANRLPREKFRREIESYEAKNPSVDGRRRQPVNA